VSRPFPSPARPAGHLAGLTALALLLAGCPIPQSLPEYPSTGTIAPPRLLTGSTTPIDTAIEVAPDCLATTGAEPVFVLHTALVDENTLEKVEARWFVDYLPGSQAREVPRAIEIIDGPADGVSTLRAVQDFTFRPYGFDPQGSEQAFRDGGGIHVVEIVVSNGFAPEPDPGEPALPQPWRTPLPQFETQLLRWVFHYAPGGTCAVAAR
jgi:hypothetical protein